MRQKLPVVLAMTALVVAVFGATPLGHAAANVVRRALFANNAGKVDGIKASVTPQPNQLVPLGPDAKFPSSVIPAGQSGSDGTGTPGPNSIGSAEVIDGSLTGADIEDGSITEAKLVDRTVRIDAPSLAYGTTQRWDIGPYISLSVNCYMSADGTHHLEESLLNNGPEAGNPSGTNMVGGQFNQPSKSYVPVVIREAEIGSGEQEILTSDADPSTKYNEGTFNFVLLVWRDGSETITGSYSSLVTKTHCEIAGALTRIT